MKPTSEPTYQSDLTHVGGSSDDSVYRSGQYIPTLPEDYYQQKRLEQLLIPGSPTRTEFTAKLIDRYRAYQTYLTRVAPRPLTLPFALSASDEMRLTRLFPGMPLEFTKVDGVAQPFMASLNLVVKTLMLRLCSRNAQCIVDISGDFVEHAINFNANVHCCLDTATPLNYDRFRRIQERGQMFGRFKAANGSALMPNIVRCLANIDHYACHQPLALCRRKADQLIVDLNQTFIRPSNLIQLIRSHGCSTAYCSFVFDPKLLFDDAGTIEPLNLRFTIDRSRDRLMFFYPGVNMQEVVYIYSEYVSYMTKTFFSVSDSVAQFEVFSSKHHPIYIGKMDLVRTADVRTREIAAHPIWLKSYVDVMFVRLQVLRSLDHDPSLRSSYVTRLITVPRRHYDNVRMQLATAKRPGSTVPKKDKLISFEQTLDMVYKTTARQILDGAQCVRTDLLQSAEDKVGFAMVLYYKAFVDQYSNSQLMRLLSAELHDRLAGAHQVPDIMTLLWRVICLQLCDLVKLFTAPVDQICRRLVEIVSECRLLTLDFVCPPEALIVEDEYNPGVYDRVKTWCGDALAGITVKQPPGIGVADPIDNHRAYLRTYIETRPELKSRVRDAPVLPVEQVITRQTIEQVIERRSATSTAATRYSNWMTNKRDRSVPRSACKPCLSYLAPSEFQFVSCAQCGRLPTPELPTAHDTATAGTPPLSPEMSSSCCDRSDQSDSGSSQPEPLSSPPIIPISPRPDSVCITIDHDVCDVDEDDRLSISTTASERFAFSRLLARPTIADERPPMKARATALLSRLSALTVRRGGRADGVRCTTPPLNQSLPVVRSKPTDDLHIPGYVAIPEPATVGDVPYFFTPTKSALVDRIVTDTGAFDVGLGDQSPFQHDLLLASTATDPITTVPVVPSPDPIGYLQSCYDRTLPGLSTVDFSADTTHMHYSDANFLIETPLLKMDMAKLTPPKPVTGYRSRLRTALAVKRQQTMREGIAGFAKRNFNCAPNSAPQDILDLTAETFDRFLDAFCVPNAREMLKTFRDNRIVPDRTLIDAWVDRLDESAVARMRDDMSFTTGTCDFSSYSAMIKSDVKPRMEVSAAVEYAPVQTVVYHEKTINAIYSPLFGAVFDRLLQILRPNVLVHTKKSAVDIQRFLNTYEDLHTPLNYIENDFSKYDKSQQDAAFRLVMSVFVQLGLDESLVATWMQGQVHNKVNVSRAGLKFYYMFQQKSGVAPTTLANTTLNMMTVAATYPLKRIQYAMFVGDDSIIAVPDKIETVGSAERMALLYNLGSKVMQKSHGYFCSAFIVKTANGVRFMSDPVKRTEKLGQMAQVRGEQLRDQYESLRNLLFNYDDQIYNEALALCVSARYATETNWRGAIDALHTLTLTFDRFRELYDDAPVTITF